MANDSEKSKPVESDSAPSVFQAKVSGENKPAEKKNGTVTFTKQDQTDSASPFSLEAVRWPHPIKRPVSVEIVRDPWALEIR